MQKIILYYLFTSIPDPEMLKLWQQSLAASNNLKGRIIVSSFGINGTLGGDIEGLKTYIKATRSYPGFKDMRFKWSIGGRDSFPKLSVKVKPELVSFGVSEKIKLDEFGVIGGGKRIGPQELHDLVGAKKEEVVFIDGRNSIEATIGRFKDAVVMDVDYSRDFPQELASEKYASLKKKTVVTYCTGGVRCEVLSKLMIDEGFENVYQLDGGIATYLDAYPDSPLWEGSLFVFDGRMALRPSEQSIVLGRCSRCGVPTENFENCSYGACRRLVLLCENCDEKSRTCPECNSLANSEML